MSDTKSDSRHRLIALFVTVAFHVAVAVLLITLYLQPVASDMERKWPPRGFFGGAVRWRICDGG